MPSNRTPTLWPEAALDDPSSSGTEVPSGSHGSERHWSASRGSGSGTQAKRNGHASVIGRLVELVLTLPPGMDQPRTAYLTFDDEVQLRDADERQLGERGLAIATSGSTAEWRAFVTAHFRRRYDMAVTFDATSTRLQ